MMRTTPTTCNANPLSLAVQIVTGTMLVAGVAALVWTLATRRHSALEDPQAEIDRRIHDLEGSLNRLQDVVAGANG